MYEDEKKNLVDSTNCIMMPMHTHANDTGDEAFLYRTQLLMSAHIGIMDTLIRAKSMGRVI